MLGRFLFIFSLGFFFLLRLKQLGSNLVHTPFNQVHVATDSLVFLDWRYLQLWNVNERLLRFFSFALLLRRWCFTFSRPTRFVFLIFSLFGLLCFFLLLELFQCLFFQLSLAFFSLLSEQCNHLFSLTYI